MEPNFIYWLPQFKMALILCQIDGDISVESLLVPNNTISGESLWQTLRNGTGMDWLSDEDIDSLAVRRELVAASVASLGDFWDNEVDRAWQDFAPEVG